MGIHALNKSLECAHKKPRSQLGFGEKACIYQMFLPRHINKLYWDYGNDM